MYKKDIPKLLVCEWIENLNGFDSFEHFLETSFDHIIKRLYVVAEELAEVVIVRCCARFVSGHFAAARRLSSLLVSPDVAAGGRV